MRFAESEIRQITESVWTSVLEMELQPGNGITPSKVAYWSCQLDLRSNNE